MNVAHMKRALLIALFTMAIPLQSYAESEDEFGTWVELGAKKVLPYNLELGMTGEFRTENNMKKVDRWNIGIDLNYRLNKHLKFAVGYVFLHGYSDEKFGKREYDLKGSLYAYRYTPGYWTPRHRVLVEGTATVKLWKWLRLSLRERYQFTHKTEKTVTGRYEASAPDWEHEAFANKFNPSEEHHSLRSRFKIGLDKKGLAWHPFAFIELYNDVASGEGMNLDKIRTAVGTEYKINSQHEVSLSYVMTADRDSQPYKRMHALCVGYTFDF